MRCRMLLSATVAMLCASVASGQFMSGLNKDSLRNVLQKAPEDSAKVFTLILLGQQYESNLPDSAIYFYKQAKELSVRIHYPAGVVRYINNYTAVLNVQGKFDESLQLNQEATALCKQYGLKELYIKSLINIGVVYQYKQDYEAAASHYLKNLPALEEAGNSQALSMVYGNLCGVYLDIGQYQQAYEYAQKELETATGSGDLYTVVAACNNLANALKGKGRMAEAIPYLERAYNTGRKIEDVNGMETALINLGDLFNKMHEPVKAIRAFQAALPLTDSLEDVYGKSLVLHGLAYSLYLQKKYQPAFVQAETALAFARKHEQQETERQLLMLLSDVAIAKGDLAGAERFRDAYDSLSAVVSHEALMKDIKVMESKYEVEKKQSHILKQNLLLVQKDRQAARQRLLLGASVGGILLLVLLLFWGVRYYRQRQLLHANALRALEVEQERMRLQSVIDGQLQERQRISQEMHDDISSGLTSLLFLSRSVQGQESVANRLRSISQDLVQKMNEIIWTLSNEQDTMESLVAYMRKQLAEMLDSAGVDYRFLVTEPLPALAVGEQLRRNVYLVAKEAVHNIIKHSGASRVDIHIEVGERLHMTIADNGKGFGGTHVLGNGVRNMRQRIAQLNGKFDITGGEGTVVAITVPLDV
ncbi:tetratricopeptide repeat-containing sensor histidine kinase [Filimonas lacunae]|nr:tetratricopeptide repeat protein [Filimonas lacunae]